MCVEKEVPEISEEEKKRMYFLGKIMYFGGVLEGTLYGLAASTVFVCMYNYLRR